MTHTPLPPFAAYNGSRQPKLLIVGEAWGGNEAELRRPFVGEAGRELFRMLGEAMPTWAPEIYQTTRSMMRHGGAWVRPREDWLVAAGIGMTNVLALRPPGNKIEELCVSKKDLPDGYSAPAIVHGKYLVPELLCELDRLQQEIAQSRPNLILALGNTACWGTIGQTNIGSIRGTVTQDQAGTKVLPSYHPAGVLRNWSWRPIVVADLMKASRECQFSELRRPERTVLVNPTLAEVQEWTRATLANPPPLLSPDIETASGQITCIGFARSRSEAMVVPFRDKSRPGWNYWESANEELAAWECVRALLESPIPKVGQNFIYDLQYLTRVGIRPRQCVEDTMLLHHSLFPEMNKGLGFLGSIYTNEASWKLMARKRADDKTVKADE